MSQATMRVLQQRVVVPPIIPFGLLVCSLGVILAHVSPSNVFASGVILVAILCLAFLVSSGAGGVLRAYVLFVAVWFFTGGILNLDPTVNLAQVWNAVAVWVFGWCGGQMLFHRGSRTTASIEKQSRFSYRECAFSLAIVGLIALCVQAVTTIHGSSSYAVQVSGGANTSLTATVVGLAGPSLAAALIFSWSSCRQWVRHLLIAAILAEGLLLAFSGFRGASIEYLMGAWLSLIAVVAPRGGEHRRLAIIGLSAVLIVSIPATLFASTIRDQLQLQAGSSQLHLTLRQLPKAAASRLDEIGYLSAGLTASGEDVRQVENAKDQISVFVPRILWRSKPIFNYGEQISTAVYHLDPSIHTSSTITWIGDLDIMGGLNLVFLAGLALGALVRQILLRVYLGSVVLVILTVLVVFALLDPENSVILSLGGLVKSLILMLVACILLNPVARFGSAK